MGASSADAPGRQGGDAWQHWEPPPFWLLLLVTVLAALLLLGGGSKL